MSKSISKEFIEEVYRIRDPNDAKKFYNEWAENYEKDSIEQGYFGGYIVVKEFLKLNLQKELRILDVGAGTGIIGHLLQVNGYENVDGLDGTENMLEIAKKKNCYKNYILSVVAPDVKLPVDDGAYDVIIFAGCLCPGHISVEALDQIRRCVKPGGLMCWAMGAVDNYKELDPGFRDRFLTYMQNSCNENKWTPVSGYPLRVEKYMLGKDGMFYVMKVN